MQPREASGAGSTWVPLSVDKRLRLTACGRCRTVRRRCSRGLPDRPDSAPGGCRAASREPCDVANRQRPPVPEAVPIDPLSRLTVTLARNTCLRLVFRRNSAVLPNAVRRARVERRCSTKRLKVRSRQNSTHLYRSGRGLG